MGEDHRRDVAGDEPERAEVRRQAAAESGQPGIDRGQASASLDQVPVHQRATEPMNPLDDIASRSDGADPTAGT
jgi:hypothetical protein